MDPSPVMSHTTLTSALNMRRPSVLSLGLFAFVYIFYIWSGNKAEILMGSGNLRPY
jgi:hypothetical protein